MDDIVVMMHDRPKLRAPILVEGLPGVGNVGKLAADHMVSELDVRPLATLHSKHFPPQVLLDDDGVARLVSNKLHYLLCPGEKDVIVLSGDYQGMDSPGQYDLADRVMAIAAEFGVSYVVTMGGYQVQRELEKPQVLGAVTSRSELERMASLGVVFSKGEPANGIVGASGLLLGMAQLRGIPGVCLMGETNGFFVSDPSSAKAVLEVLSRIIGVTMDYSKLEKKARDLAHFQQRLKEIEAEGSSAPPTDPDHLQYIG